MKELSIEEKAKAYDEAKARMSRAFNSNRCTIGFMNEIFPELKESEDKEIREQIVYAINKLNVPGSEKNKLLAWLEKQGEQKPFDYENADIQQKDFAPKETVKEAESNLTPLERKVKDILFSFHINAADGISFDGTMAIVHNLITLCQQEQKPAWSEDDEVYLNTTIAYLKDAQEFKKTAENCIGWLKSIKQRIGGK